MPGSVPHRSRYAPLRRDTASSSAPSRLRSAYLDARAYLDRTWQAFLALPPGQRYIIYLAVGIKALIFAVVVYIGPEAMFDATAKLAIWFGAQPLGAALLIALVVAVSFPPLVGYGTCITLFGLGWGVQADATAEHPKLNGNLWHAWLLASTACLLGATVSFGVLRFLIVHHSKRVAWISSALNDPKFVALSTAVRRRGLSMAILIRFCPFPFAYSNLFFASLVDAVSLGHFLAATALITPKLLLHVWIGTRMFVLMDREQRAHLDGWAKALNVLYIIIGSAVGAATGWIVWSETKKVLHAIEQEAQVQEGQAQPSRRARSSRQTQYRDSSPDLSAGEAGTPFVLDVEGSAESDSDADEVGRGLPARDRASKDKQSLLPR